MMTRMLRKSTSAYSYGIQKPVALFRHTPIIVFIFLIPLILGGCKSKYSVQPFSSSTSKTLDNDDEMFMVDNSKETHHSIDYNDNDANKPGIYVFDPNEKERSFVLPDKSHFLERYGFLDGDAYFVFKKDDHVDYSSLMKEMYTAIEWRVGIKYLELYFDEKRGEGCGIHEGNNGHTMGFVFDSVREEPWEPIDYSEPFSALEYIYGVNYDISDDTEYSYISEYDERGNLVYYSVTSDILYDGVIYEDSTDYEVHFRYDENNTLRYRFYHCSNTVQFGSEMNDWEIYFDEMGRIEYMSYYITHGWYYVYYIYDDNDHTPAYGIFIDNNLGQRIVDRFVRYY